jgi:mannose-6-phosphate isomerase-like protein (cupin superfamily)
MALFHKADEVEAGTMDMGVTSFTTKMVYGQYASLMIAERPPGYHSKPHIHDCEQLNYMQKGSLHIYFADGRLFCVKEGDFLRIPPNVVHWSWNKGTVPCVLIEVHTPGIQDDPMNTGYARALLDETESAPEHGPKNEFVDPNTVDIAKVESSLK